MSYLPNDIKYLYHTLTIFLLAGCKLEPPPVVSSESSGAVVGLNLTNTSLEFYDTTCKKTNALKIAKNGFKGILLYRLKGSGNLNTYTFGFQHPDNMPSEDLKTVGLAVNPAAVIFDPALAKLNSSYTFRFIARNKEACLNGLKIKTFKDAHPNLSCDLDQKTTSEIFPEFDISSEVYFTVLPEVAEKKKGIISGIIDILTGKKINEIEDGPCLGGLEGKVP